MRNGPVLCDTISNYYPTSRTVVLNLGYLCPQGVRNLKPGCMCLVASKVCITNPFHMFVFILDGDTREFFEISRAVGTDKKLRATVPEQCTSTHPPKNTYTPLKMLQEDLLDLYGEYETCSTLGLHNFVCT